METISQGQGNVLRLWTGLGSDETYRHYCNEVAKFPERQGLGRLEMMRFDVEKAVGEQLEESSPQDKPMRNLLLDLIVAQGWLFKGLPLPQHIADAHSALHSCLNGATKADYCARHHTHGDAPCRTIFAPKTTPDHNAWRFYNEFAPLRLDLWDDSQDIEAAREMFHVQMLAAFAEIQKDRLDRAAVRVAQLLDEPFAQQIANALLGNGLGNSLSIPLQDMEKWIGVLAG